eukprot:PhM_4_TR17422/c4_g3_i1/m.78024
MRSLSLALRCRRIVTEKTMFHHTTTHIPIMMMMMNTPPCVRLSTRGLFSSTTPLYAAAQINTLKKPMNVVEIYSGDSGSGKSVAGLMSAAKPSKLSTVSCVILTKAHDVIGRDLDEKAPPADCNNKAVSHIQKFLEQLRRNGRTIEDTSNGAEVVLVVDEIGSYPVLLRAICAARCRIVDVIKEVFKVTHARIIAVGTGAGVVSANIPFDPSTFAQYHVETELWPATLKGLSGRINITMFDCVSELFKPDTPAAPDLRLISGLVRNARFASVFADDLCRAFKNNTERRSPFMASDKRLVIGLLGGIAVLAMDRFICLSSLGGLHTHELKSTLLHALRIMLDRTNKLSEVEQTLITRGVLTFNGVLATDPGTSKVEVVIPPGYPTYAVSPAYCAMFLEMCDNGGVRPVSHDGFELDIVHFAFVCASLPSFKKRDTDTATADVPLLRRIISDLHQSKKSTPSDVFQSSNRTGLPLLEPAVREDPPFTIKRGCFEHEAGNLKKQWLVEQFRNAGGRPLVMLNKGHDMYADVFVLGSNRLVLIEALTTRSGAPLQASTVDRKFKRILPALGGGDKGKAVVTALVDIGRNCLRSTPAYEVDVVLAYEGKASISEEALLERLGGNQNGGPYKFRNGVSTWTDKKNKIRYNTYVVDVTWRPSLHGDLGGPLHPILQWNSENAETSPSPQ